jgi:hypothetical protein
LPGDGTFALAFAVEGAATALVGAHFADRAWTDAIVRPLEAGARRLPLVGAEWITHLEIALRDDGDAAAASAWRLDSAWEHAADCPVREVGGATLIELVPTGADPLELDGTIALEFVLDAPNSGLAHLRAGPDAALEFPLRAGRSRCVIPLRIGGARAPLSARQIALELPPGAAIDGEVGRLELGVAGATMRR